LGAAVVSLTDHLGKQSTGRLTVGKGESSVAVYLMNGGVIATETKGDAQKLLRRLRSGGALTTERASELEDANGGLIEALVGEIDEDVLKDALYERFRDNLIGFLGSSFKPRFKKMPAIWLDNIQIGHDDSELIGECAALLAAAAGIGRDATVYVGDEEPEDETQSLVHERVGDGMSAGELLTLLPVEPFAGRALLAMMLMEGVLSDEPPVDEEEEAEEEEAEGAATAEEAAPEEAEAEPDEAEPDVSAMELDDDALDVDAPAKPDDGGVVAAPKGGLAGFFAPTDDFGIVDDEFMDAFADNEGNRGAGSDDQKGGGGGFTTEAHKLDVVDVDVAPDFDPEEEGDPDEMLSGGEAVASYSAPVMDEDSAESKVQQANTTIQIMVKAVDEASGSGAGRAAMQLLVDGTPMKFKSLFASVVVMDDGSLPVDSILDNLYTRPASEHRTLLSSGLIDVIERGLDIMGDDLGDDQFDAMYEAVAGYRQKLQF